MITIEEVEAIFEEKQELFRNNKLEMIAAYRRDKQNAEAYNGRQMLELLQNCDDADSSSVKICLDTENKILSIYNIGIPFSEGGYRSLAISDLSEKSSKKQFIGSKGLGFRSLLYWAHEIDVISNNLKVNFSETSRRILYNDIVSEAEDRTLREKYGIPDNIAPIPMLSAPRVDTCNELDNNYTTLIRIKYHDHFEEDIKTQIKEIDPETVIFLNHIKEVNFVGIDKKDIICQKKALSNNTGPSELVRINKKSWFVYKKLGVIDDLQKDEHGQNYIVKLPFECKIALNKKLDIKESCLYSFFKTKDKLALPFLAHATVELDQNRNHLNINDRNKKVLDHLIDLMFETAEYLKTLEVNWNPYLMLKDHGVQDGHLREFGFLEKIRRKRKKSEIIPCVDNTYRTSKRSIYISNSFANFIQKNNYNSDFPNHIKRTNDSHSHIIYSLLNELGDNKSEDVCITLQSISNKIDKIEIRAEFINLLLNHRLHHQIDIFIDENKNIVPHDFNIYTPSTIKLTIPEVFNIRMINEELYSQIKHLYRKSNDVEDEKSMLEALNTLSTIQSFNTQHITQEIIRQLNEIISNSHPEPVELTRKTLRAIYQNYSVSNEELPVLDERIHLINKNNDLRYADQLLFSTEYNSGKITSILFGEIYTNDMYLASPTTLGLTDISFEKLEIFFKWLGVCEYSVLECKKHQDKNEVLSILNQIGDVKMQNNLKEHTLVEIKYKTVKNLNLILSQLPKESILAWLFFDKKILNRLQEKITDILQYSNNCKSYYYLAKAFNKIGFNFSDYILDRQLLWLNKENLRINFESDIFKKLNIPRRSIEDILSKLGAVDDFSQLSLESVVSHIKNLPARFPDGKHSALLYKKAVDYSRKDNSKINSSIKLFAYDSSNNLRPTENNKVYFSEKATIPRRLRDNYPILNFPNRGGGKRAIEFFGINDLQEIKLKVIDYTLDIDLTNKLNRFIERLSPYIFVYRTSNIRLDDQKRTEAKKLKALKINLCNKVTCQIEQNERYSIDDFELVTEDRETFFVKIKNGISSLTELRNNSIFSDKFAEILTNLFDATGEKDSFRSIFRENAFQDIEHQAINEFGIDALEVAKILLGQLNYEEDFWHTITKLHYNKDVITEEEVSKLKKEFNDLEIDYDNLDSTKNYDPIQSVFSKLKISVKDFNFDKVNIINFKKHHEQNLFNYFSNQKNKVKSAIYKNLQDGNINQKKSFLNQIYNFDSFESYVSEIAEENMDAFCIDTKAIFNKYINKKFPEIDLNIKTIDFNQIEKEASGVFNIFELEIINERPEFRSLLYFNDCINHLKELITDETDKLKTKSRLHEEFDPDTLKITTLDENIRTAEDMSTMLKSPDSFNIQEKTFDNSKAPFFPSNFRKNISGVNSEEKVYQYLVKKYGSNNVEFQSKFDKFSPYDIDYTPDNGKSRRYVEVKTFNSKSFIISDNEKKFGEKHSKNYEVWLVNNNDIFIITEIFSSPDWQYKVKDYYFRYLKSN